MADKYGSLYDHIISYQITAVCTEPMHVGGNKAKSGGVLVHPVKNVPFIQATGIAGALRDYLEDEKELQEQIFGKTADGTDTGSRVRISDAFFSGTVVPLELRPRVRINRETGSRSGQKFETESVAAGSEFKFSLYLYQREHEYEATLERILGALHAGNIQFGGQKNNGCGYVRFLTVVKTDYDMKIAEDRKLWSKESKAGVSILDALKKQIFTLDQRIHFELDGEIDSALLVRAMAAQNHDEEAQSAEQIRTANGRLLVPATSVKGVVRSQMEKIAKFKGLPESEMERIFGKNAEKEEKGYLGFIHFFDVIIEGEMRPVQKRIHIDKFTGGVMYGGLFHETPAAGRLQIRADLEKEDKRAAGLLLMALRDLGLGILPLGSGSSIGRGFLTGTQLRIKAGTELIAKINLQTRKVEQGAELIGEYIKAV